MENYKNANVILENVNKCIKELEDNAETFADYDHKRLKRKGWSDNTKVFDMWSVCDELSIFDWWNDRLSMSQLKQMKSFIETAIKLGFKGYVCFKVGAKGCANGMWAHKEESTNGYSPDGDVLYHSFVSGRNDWSVCLNDEWSYDIGLKAIKKML